MRDLNFQRCRISAGGGCQFCFSHLVRLMEGSDLLKLDWPGATILRPYDDCASQLVVPPLLPAVEGNPKQTDPEREDRNKVGQVAAYGLADGQRVSGGSIDDPSRDCHLSGSCLHIQPESDCSDCRRHP